MGGTVFFPGAMGNIEFDFSNETVIVTGGSSGIGRAIARRFGDSGATVINADLRSTPKDEDRQRPTHETIESNGGTAEYVELDVADPDSIQTAVDQAGQYGGVDIMVNNAGTTTRGSILDVPKEDVNRLHNVNTIGVYFGTQSAANDMVDRGTRGAIINTASISSTYAQGGMSPYEATKGAVKMITRSAAFELAEHDIRVNAIAPGQIATEFSVGATEKEKAIEEGNLVKEIPLDRPGYPEDLTGAALYLASDDASYVTGEMVYVDGGWQVY